MAKTTEDVDAGSLTTQVTAWLGERFAESGAATFVLGLSGGIDSAVVCGLCVRAVGAGKVLGVIMPSASNPDDAVQAAKVAQSFGVKTLTVDLTSVAQTFYGSMPTVAALDALGVLDPGSEDLAARQRLATANARPRLRMTTLYYVANLVKGIVTGTGNKSEAMIGYFTKYGDGGVDLFPLIDFYKHEVRAIARYIGVPQSVIDRPPSAGLWQGQTDEDEIGVTYDVLDEALEAILAGETAGIDATVLARVGGLHRSSEHKREPVPAFKRSA
ncbi:MAG TPA: NAD(+) synthase [Thermomicrobiales bacterium]|nr:NAD(+) synthase [Thermomicrobiales bacterium]